jgi:hypothetical protein
MGGPKKDNTGRCTQNLAVPMSLLMSKYDGLRESQRRCSELWAAYLFKDKSTHTMAQKYDGMRFLSPCQKAMAEPQGTFLPPLQFHHRGIQGAFVHSPGRWQ